MRGFIWVPASTRAPAAWLVCVCLRRYLCNLGIPRRRLRAIVIRTSACHIQIAPTPGSSYSLYWQGEAGEGVQE